jgi:hypothetical protein
MIFFKRFNMDGFFMYIQYTSIIDYKEYLRRYRGEYLEQCNRELMGFDYYIVDGCGKAVGWIEMEKHNVSCS